MSRIRGDANSRISASVPLSEQQNDHARRTKRNADQLAHISIEPAAPAIAELLNIVPDFPVLALDRVVHTIDGRRAEWRTGYCHLGSEYTYLAEMK